MTVPHNRRFYRATRRPRRSDGRQPSCLDKFLTKLFNCSRRLSHYWFTHLLLIAGLVVYTLVGAVMFCAVEKDNEMVIRQRSRNIRKELVDKLWNVCTNVSDTSKGSWSNQSKALLWGYREGLCAADAWFEETGGDFATAHSWTLPNAIFFCGSITSMIGYGHLTPKTKKGQLCTIGYALIGIPYVLILLADVGQVLRTILGKIYVGIYKFYYLGKCCRWHITPPQVLVSRFFNKAHFVPGTSRSINSEDTNGVSTSPSYIEGGTSGMRLADEDSLYQLSGFRQTDFVIPIWVGGLLLTVYTVVGAWCFSVIENWNFVEALYFIVVSLTTVGFGDFLPERLWFVVFFSYILVGMTFISLFFNLVLESIQTGVKKAHRKITRAWTARVSVVETGASTANDVVDERASSGLTTPTGSILDVHVVESSPFCVVPCGARPPPTSLSTIGRQQYVNAAADDFSGRPLSPDDNPSSPVVLLVQMSDTRLLDYTLDDLQQQTDQPSSVARHSRDRRLGSGSRTLQISESSLLEYMQERMAMADRSSNGAHQLLDEHQPELRALAAMALRDVVMPSRGVSTEPSSPGAPQSSANRASRHRLQRISAPDYSPPGSSSMVRTRTVTPTPATGVGVHPMEEYRGLQRLQPPSTPKSKVATFLPQIRRSHQVSAETRRNASPVRRKSPAMVRRAESPTSSSVDVPAVDPRDQPSTSRGPQRRSGTTRPYMDDDQ